MGREVRRVPKDWQHPRDDREQYTPLHEGYADAARRWDDECASWCRGERPDYFDHSQADEFPSTPRGYALWNGRRPSPDEHMPDWPDSERTHLQMYECTTEGTPISPVMETPEQLARWLTDNGASIFGGDTTDYETWLHISRGAGTCVGIMIGGCEPARPAVVGAGPEHGGNHG